LAGGVIIWLILRQYVTTDDAFIDGHVTQVGPQVSARVVRLHFDDNQFVHHGNLLVELDPTDYQAALDQAAAQVASAQGKLDQARAQVVSADASVRRSDAEVDAAQSNLENISRDTQRLEDVDARARSQ